jgi:gamma-glutamylputrescine oxidase
MMSIWERETFFAPQDVIIAGSGFVGLWSALFLKKKHPKAKITILDRGLIPTGASTRNAGFACFGSLTEVVSDAETMGLQKTLELVEMRFKGLEQIQKFIKASKIDFSLCGGYELFHSDESMPEEKLRHHITYLNTLLKNITGSKKTYRLADDRIEAFGFGNTAHMVENRFEGYLHSGKLVQALMRVVQRLGVQIFAGIEIESFEKGSGDIEITTAQSVSFSTKQLLICTNAFAKDLLPDADIIPARGQVFVTSPIKDLPWCGAFHFDEGYYYFRNLGNRVLLGGARNKDFEGERTTSFDTTATIQQALENFLRLVILPHCKEHYTVEHRWSGIMAMGSEKSPIVKEVQSGVFCAVRMSGMGVALAPVVARQVSSLMLA